MAVDGIRSLPLLLKPDVWIGTASANVLAVGFHAELRLLAKLKAGSHDIKAEIICLFAAKLLDFVRNPFSIAKALNTFPALAGAITPRQDCRHLSRSQCGA